MGSFKDLTGGQFGHWAVLSRAPNIGKRTAYFCRCDCGVERRVSAVHLTGNASKSCGQCSRPKGAAHVRFKHGASETDLYSIWCAIKQRCFNPNTVGAHLYINRGISMHPEWARSFEKFAQDIGPRPTIKHSVGRIDGSKGYEPGNVRWETPKQQARNFSRNRLVEYNGRMMPLVEAAELAGVNYGTAKWRLNRGLPLDRPVPRGRR
jgi:hypothetical protein